MKRFIPWLVIVAVVAVGVFAFVKFGPGPEGGPSDRTEIPVAAPAPVEPPPIVPPPAPAEPTAAEVFQKALAEEEAGRTAAAKTMYAKVLQMEPDGGPADKAALRLADIAFAAGDKPGARNYYTRALQGSWPATQRQQIINQIATLNQELLFGSGAGTGVYVVKSGDALIKIAKQYKITYPFLMKLNNLSSTVIHPDQKLKVIQGPFDALVDKSDLTLTILHNGNVLKQYRVGLGKDDSTPVGTYNVLTKQENPDWHTPEGVIPYGDPENILGTRWVGFDQDRGFGIHGTTKPDSIGLYSSQGCVRMLNAEAEEVFDYLVRQHSKVIIQE